MLTQGWLYLGQTKIVAELNGAGAVVSHFVFGTKANVPEYMIKGGTTYRIITDHLGSPRLVVDVTTGAVAQRMDFDEWGRVTNDTNPGFQPFGFAGGLYDQHTKLVRFGARDYDAEIGRWTLKDPAGFAGDSTGLYRYAANDPVNRFDREGRKVEFATWEAAKEFIGPLVDMLFTQKGKELLDQLMDSDKIYTIAKCQKNLANPSDKPVQGLGPRTACINPSEKLEIKTTAGNKEWTTPGKLAHELGHLAGCPEGPDEMQNIRTNENPVTRELYGYERTSYEAPLKAVKGPPVPPYFKDSTR